MQALYRQLSFELERFNVQKKQLDTLFIGGGTPSTISPELYAPLFELLSPYLKDGAEITTEANPNSATEEWLKGMKSLGVTRISFGVQSFNMDKLTALNRSHTPDQARNAVLTAEELGFEHLSIDLIYNYIGDSKTLLRDDIKEAFELPIDHISAYELTIEEGTKFSATPEVSQENEPLAFFVAKEIQERGMVHYEISNYGNYQSRHNKGYWELENYIGAGAGAVGFLNDTRFYPQTDIEMYMADPLKIKKEYLSGEELLTEKIFLGLRSNTGIAKKILNETMREKVQLLVAENKVTETETRVYNKNFFIADALALYLLE